MNGRAIPGVRFAPDKFTPDSGLFKGELCEGARVEVTNRTKIRALRMGMEIAAILQKLYPGQFQVEKMIALVGNDATVKKLEMGDASASIIASWKGDLKAFRRTREKYLLYPPTKASRGKSKG